MAKNPLGTFTPASQLSSKDKAGIKTGIKQRGQKNLSLLQQIQASLGGDGTEFESIIGGIQAPVNTSGFKESLLRIPELLASAGDFEHASDKAQFRTSIGDIKNILGAGMGVASIGQLSKAAELASNALGSARNVRAGSTAGFNVEQPTSFADIRAGGDPNDLLTIEKNGKQREISRSALSDSFLKAGFKVIGETGKQLQFGAEAPSQVQTFSGGNRTTPSIVDFLDSVGQPSDKASRALLAEQLGIKDYKFTAEQNTAMLNMLRGKTPPTPAPLSEDTLDGAEKDIDTGELPEGTPSDKYGASAEADRVIADIENKRKILDETDSPLQDKNEELLLEQMENVAGIEGRAKLKAELEQEKLDPLDAEIDSLTVELQTLKNEKDRLLVEQRGKPITMASIIGSQAQISAVMDSKILGISGMIDALNGNYERAEKSIQRAIDAEFGPAEEKIAINKAQVEALKNSGLLTRDEEIQADAITAEKDRQEQVLADQKAEKKDIQGLLVDYIKAGGKDPNVIERIRNSKSFDDALVELGENFPTKSTGGGSGAGGTGLTPTKLATARANFLNDNPNNTLADFDALSDDDKLRWSTGGPDTGGIPGVAEIEDIIIQYQEAGYTQKEIESQMKSDTGLDDLPTPYRQALDNSFPKAGLLGQGGFVDRVTDFFRG
jgi:hypothetical protein